MRKSTRPVPRTAPIMRGSSALSSRRCVWNACQIWRNRSLRAAFAACLAAFFSSLLAAPEPCFAMAPILPYGDTTTCRESGAEAREHFADLLAGRPLLRELGHPRRQLLAAGEHGLGVEPPGAVRRAHQRSGHHAGEAHRERRIPVLDELLGLDPPLHRVVAQA